MKKRKWHCKKWTYKLTIKIPEDEGIRGYIAGLIDGEGSIVLMHRKRIRFGKVYETTEVSLQIINTSVELMKWLVNVVGGRYRDETRFKEDGNFSDHRTKPIYVWRTDAKANVKALLEACLPYLVIKKKKALEVINELKNVSY